jgi:hypothetical protein
MKEEEKGAENIAQQIGETGPEEEAEGQAAGRLHLRDHGQDQEEADKMKRLEVGGWRPDWLKLAMRAAIAAAVIYFGIGVFCQAAEPWDKTDLALGLGLLASRAVDYGQTRYAAQHPDRYWEMNPCLPEHPSEDQVATFFIAGTLVDAAVAHFLPDVLSKAAGWLGYALTPAGAHGLRKVYLSVRLGSSLATVAWNHQVGVKVAW